MQGGIPFRVYDRYFHTSQKLFNLLKKKKSKTQTQTTSPWGVQLSGALAPLPWLQRGTLRSPGSLPSTQHRSLEEPCEQELQGTPLVGSVSLNSRCLPSSPLGCRAAFPRAAAGCFPQRCSGTYPLLPTESQHGRGWQGPLWVIWSNPPAEAGSPRAGCTAPCPGGSGMRRRLHSLSVKVIITSFIKQGHRRALLTASGELAMPRGARSVSPGHTAWPQLQRRWPPRPAPGSRALLTATNTNSPTPAKPPTAAETRIQLGSFRPFQMSPLSTLAPRGRSPPPRPRPRQGCRPAIAPAGWLRCSVLAAAAGLRLAAKRKRQACSLPPGTVAMAGRGAGPGLPVGAGGPCTAPNSNASLIHSNTLLPRFKMSFPFPHTHYNYCNSAINWNKTEANPLQYP